MNGGVSMIAALLAAGLLLAPASAGFARSNQNRGHSSPHQTVAQPPARIACTALGCQPIPAGAGTNLERVADRL
jgi:hypothetical protein